MYLRSVSGLLLVFTLLMPLQGRADASEAIPGEFIVKFKHGTSSLHVHNKIQGKGQMKAAFSEGHTFHLAFKPEDTSSVEALKNDPEIEFVEPNYLLKPLSEDQPGVIVQTVTPDQIQRPSGLSAQSVTVQTAGVYDQSGANIHVTEAWAQSQPYSVNNRPIVAVIDTGLDSSHYVFSQTGALWVNTQEIPGNGIDDDFNGYVDDVSGWNFVINTANFFDDEGHGTHVSGIVLGATQDVLKTPPLQPAKIRIMPLKFLDSSGSGSTSNAVSAVYYAVNNGAKVINCSWGGGSYSRALHEAFTFAYTHGVLVASAAGNYSSNNDTTDMYPANYDVPSNVSVAATNDYDYLASFSNYGFHSVPIASPGVLIYSTVPGGNFGLMSGTSMATPLVAGAAALAFREAPQLSGFQMKGLLMSSSTPVTQLNNKDATGARIDVLDLLNSAQLQHFTAASQPDYTPQFKADRSVASQSASSPGAAGCGLIGAMSLKGPGGGSFSDMSWIAIFLLLPLFIWISLRQINPQSRRRYDRFRMSSSVKVMLGDRELTGQMQTISLGGLSFNADEALEKGHTVTMKIASPDGKDLVEVEGRIVWSEASSSYGVQFAQTQMSVLDKINNWTRQLVRAAN
jgi:subtilisin family serine protease